MVLSPFSIARTLGWRSLASPCRYVESKIACIRFVLDLSADAYGATELAINAVSNAQLWHRRLDHLNRRSLELMQRHDGKGITFDGTIADCDACVVGKGQQLAHPKKAQHVGITRPFQLRYGDLMGPFTLEAYRGLQICQQDHRPVHQVDRRLLPGEQELRLRLLSPVRHINCHPLRRPSHSLTCRQRRGIHERSVQAVLLGNRHHPGVCGHPHASVKRRVRARWTDPSQYGSLPSRRQWTPAQVVGRARAHWGLPLQPYVTFRA